MAEVNWSENVEYSATGVVSPSTVEQLQELVAGAERVKALGTRHSFSRVADTTGQLISTAGLVLEPSIDHEGMTATVPGGWSYARVAAYLEHNGVALQNMGSLPHISLAGGTATGTHGSGNTNQILAAEIAALDIVSADGSLRRLDRSAPEWGAVAVGLGAFGVITLVTLDVVPSYLMRQDLYSGASWETVLEDLDEIMASAYSVNLHADYSSTHTRTIWQKSIVEVGETNGCSDPEIVHELWGASRRDIEEIDPGRTTTLAPAGPWCDRLPHFVRDGSPSVSGDELQTEYFVDAANGPAALATLRQMGERIDRHLHGAEIRTVAADDLWLSPTIGRQCLSIGFTWKKHAAEVTDLLPDIERSLQRFDPTPHWGKLFGMERAELAERFARLDDFVALATSWDPGRKFANPFLDHLWPN